MDEDFDFTSPWAQGDIALLVEGKPIYCNKSTLSMWSPVFNAMLTAEFKEKDAQEIKLPEKTYEEVLELVKVIHPSQKEVKDANVAVLLKFADEYQMSRLGQMCNTYLLTRRQDTWVLSLADRFQLTDVRDGCLQELGKRPVKDWGDEKMLEQCSTSTLLQLLLKRAKLLDDINGEREKYDIW